MFIAELVPTILQVIFSGFSGLCKAADASGEDGLYLRTVDAIGVLHFDGIERSQSSARSATGIEESSALLQLPFDGGNQLVNGRQCLFYCHSHLLVFCIDMSGEFIYAHLFEMFVERALLCYSLFFFIWHITLSLGCRFNVMKPRWSRRLWLAVI